MEKYFFSIIAGILVIMLYFATITLWVHKERRFYISIALYVSAVILSGPLGMVYIGHPEWQDFFEGSCVGGAWGGLFWAAIYIRDYVGKEIRPKKAWKGAEGSLRIFFSMMTLLFTVLFFYFLIN